MEPVKHPAKYWYNSLLWHDRSDESEQLQMIDLLHDIRLLLLVIVVILLALR